ncbi:hypothetical protein TNCV_1119891 [Trichonephila clavipes]|uniref:Uncharacterized protein n=1 Tax=Trichonephila clavipes TaxID=2585209 RepID=A0A8X6SZA7_TRICX|nr:hypothetical protein TNCV_1119891 [Trichonephila clavipes]
MPKDLLVEEVIEYGPQRPVRRWCLLVVKEKGAHRDHLVGVVHHGDEQVEQHHHVDDAVGSEHEQTPEAGIGLNARQFEAVQVDEPEARPEQRL